MKDSDIFTLAAMPHNALVEYVEALQKECDYLDNENKFLNWEFQNSLSFFSRAATLAHQLNAAPLETIIDVATTEVAAFFKCSFSAFYIYSPESAAFRLARSSAGPDALPPFQEKEAFFRKLFLSRGESYIVDHDANRNCLVFEDGETFDSDIPENWAALTDSRALVFPLRVPRPDSPEPQFLGGLILGCAEGKLEGRDAESAQFFVDLLSSSLHNAQLVDKLNALTIIDPLTNIFNRRHLLSQLDSAMILARRLGHELCISMADIDLFKRVNDEHGHIYGDEVLRTVAKTLKSGIRAGVDLAARYGGEEFVIVMPFTSLDAATEVSERLRIAIRDSRARCGNVELAVTCSFGVAQFVVDDTPEKFIDRADIALYQAKNAGRDRVVSATGY